MLKSSDKYQQYDIDFWKQWSIKELDRQMAPIHWIVNKDKRETYNLHVNISATETAKARESIPCQLDISYGDHEDKKLDIYGSNLPATAPTFFWVHGGYWRTGDRSWSAPFAINAYNWGIRSIVIDYPLAPKARIVEMSNAISEALAKSMRLFNESQFILGGHSAGGQLVVTLFHEIPQVIPYHKDFIDRIAGAFLISAAFDMRAITKLPSVNKALQMKEEQVVDFSAIMTMDKIYPELLNRKNKMEFHIVNGENDPPALKRFAATYSDMLRKKQFISEHRVVSDDDHFTVVDNMVNPDSIISKTLKLFILNRNNAAMKHSKL